MGVIDTGIIHGAVLGALRRLLTAERTDVSPAKNKIILKIRNPITE